MKCKCGAFIGSGRLSDTCGQCKTNHESSNKDCLLILEQSERIKELESPMQEFIDWMEEPAVILPAQMEEWMIATALRFKQLLEKV